MEDIDCTLRSGARLYVQAKERGPRGRPIGIADVANAITHAALPLTDGGSNVLGSGTFALVTDGDVTGGVVATGWHTALPLMLVGDDEGTRTLESLVRAVAERLPSVGLPAELARDLVEVTSVVRQPAHLGPHVEGVLREHLGMPAAVAWLAYGRLITHLARITAQQRSRTRQGANRFSGGDLDAMLVAVQEMVDADALDAAVRDGAVRPVDYTRVSDLARAQFLMGIETRPEHVAAGLDVTRVEELSAVLDGLASRHDVVVVGPSGCGKSALLWRAAREVGRGARPIEVLRCGNDEAVTLLVRHVRLQEPSPEAPVLVCADDLGRDTMSHWPHAREQLRGLPGVVLLAAVRREDFTARLAGSASVVEPRLTASSAELVYDAVAQTGITPRLEREEATARAGGLLMEFISLITTGKRIRAVLESQVEALSQPERRLQRNCLRLVTAAHTMGSALSATSLAAHLISVSPSIAMDDVRDALEVLQGEHLLQPTPEGFWRGLHDLRTEVLVELLHSSALPPLADTYAEALPLLPPMRRGEALRRAAVRVCAALVPIPTEPSQALSRCIAAVLPLADAAGRTLASLPNEAQSCPLAVDLLEGAVRADAAVYAAVCLPYLQEQRQGGVDTHGLATLTYACRNQGISFGDHARRLDAIAARLPEDCGPLHQRVGSYLNSDKLVALVTRCSLLTAVTVLEAAEPVLRVSLTAAATVWQHHVPHLPTPPGIGFDTKSADLRARLAASLVALADAHGDQVVVMLGPVADRVADAVAAEPYGLSVELRPETETRPSVPGTGQPDRAANPLEIRPTRCYARKLVETRKHQRSSGYRDNKPQLKGDNSINDQAVALARRLFDIAPEAEQVDIDVLGADLRPAQPDGNKRLPRGRLRRYTQTRASIAYQAATARLLAAHNWTERLRQQATTVTELERLLTEVPLRLRTHDSAGRRRDFLTRADAIQNAVAALPRRPMDDAATDQWPTEVQHWEVDEHGREKDLAHDALVHLATTIHQVARGLTSNNEQLLRGAAFHFAEAPKRLRAARATGAPTFAGVGDTLPATLDGLAQTNAELLEALQRAPSVQTEIDRAAVSDPVAFARDAAAKATQKLAAEDLKIAQDWFAAREILADFRITPTDSRSMSMLDRYQVLVAIPIERWANAIEALQQWPVEQRSGLTGGLLAVPVAEQTLLPSAVRLRGGAASPWLETDPEVLRTAGAALSLPVPNTASLTQEITRTVEDLTEASMEKVRDACRDRRWARPPRVSQPANELTRRLGAQFASATEDREINRVAIDSLVQLCNLVEAEDGNSGGLATALASSDPINLNASSDNPYLAHIGVLATLGTLVGCDRGLPHD